MREDIVLITEEEPDEEERRFTSSVAYKVLDAADTEGAAKNAESSNVSVINTHIKDLKAENLPFIIHPPFT